jgi:hypothetical protein
LLWIDLHRQRHCATAKDRGRERIGLAAFELSGAAPMRRIKPQPIRNRLDLADVRQVRSMKKRLRLSEGELNELVGRIGNSIAAISKEVALKKARRLPAAHAVPDAALIAGVTDPAAAAEPAITPQESDGTAI